MNYDDHLSRYEERQKQLEAQQLEADKRRLIALEEAFLEADTLVEEVISPELQILRDALVKHHLPARLTLMREISELSPDSTFAVGIELWTADNLLGEVMRELNAKCVRAGRAEDHKEAHRIALIAGNFEEAVKEAGYWPNAALSRPESL